MIPAIIEDLLDHGFSVIPQSGKVPLIKWAEYQTRKPGYEQTQQWAEQFPGRGWALLCGEHHGLVVVDGDSIEACAYIEAVCIPTPFRVKSRRGKHYYYRHPGHRVASKRYLDEPEIDVKGDGGLCTALGSVRQDGFTYELDDGADLVSIHDLPIYDKTWFPLPDPVIPQAVDLSKYSGMTQFERAKRYIEKAENVSSGGRNLKALSVAYNVCRGFGLPYDQGLDLMRSWNALNAPPLDDSELQTVVKSALRSGRQAVGSKCAIF